MVTLNIFINIQKKILLKTYQWLELILFEDIEKMRAAGLAIGGNLNNAIVVDKYKVLNPDGLRLENEFLNIKL